MISVVQISSKQYCVKPGQELRVDRINKPAGEVITFPSLLGADSVQAEVVAHILDKKVMTRKFRNKTRYHRVKGHRQPITVLRFRATEVKTTPVKAKQVKEIASVAK